MAECHDMDNCGWCGSVDDCIHPEHDPDSMQCPMCREAVFVYDTGARDQTKGEQS